MSRANNLVLPAVLAYYFQIRGSSALRSGVQLLPMIAGVVTALVLGGGAAPVVGYTQPFLLSGSESNFRSLPDSL